MKKPTQVENTDWFSFVLNEDSKAAIPVGPRFQADVPEWNGPPQREYPHKTTSKSFSSKWLGTVIWSNKDTSVETDRDAIGKGRPQHCDCYNPGSLLCVKRHITLKISDLQKDLGSAFQIWKFDEMGEVVAKSWKHSEQQKFARVVKTNPISEGRIDEDQINEQQEVSSKIQEKRTRGKSKEISEMEEELKRPKKKIKGKVVESVPEVEIKTQKDKRIVSVDKKNQEKCTPKKKTNVKMAAVKKRKKYESENEEPEREEDGKKYEPANLQIRGSPKILQNVIGSCTTGQFRALEEMGFGDYCGEFNFDSTLTGLAMWLCNNFDSESCSLVLSDERKIKVTRDVIHQILGIPMGDIKVDALPETTTADATTVKWRQTLPSDVYDPDGPSHKKKIPISRLETYISESTDDGWAFKVGFLVIFFTIFGHGNKDGSVNQRFLPSVEDVDNVRNLDWCTYCLECLQDSLKNFKPRLFFSGPILLLTLIYVNSTVSETTRVDRTVPSFLAWSSKLLKQREKEEIAGGFGQLPIVKGMQFIDTPKKKQKKNLKKKKNKMIETEENDRNNTLQLYTSKVDLIHGLYEKMNRDAELEDFKSKSIKEMKDCLKDFLAESKDLMMRTHDKLNLALITYPDDEEINKMLEERNTFINKLLDESYNFKNNINEENKFAKDTDGGKNGYDDETDNVQDDTEDNDEAEKVTGDDENLDQDEGNDKAIEDLEKERLVIPKSFFAKKQKEKNKQMVADNQTEGDKQTGVKQKEVQEYKEADKNLAIVVFDESLLVSPQTSQESSQALIGSDKSQEKIGCDEGQELIGSDKSQEKTGSDESQELIGSDKSQEKIGFDEGGIKDQSNEIQTQEVK